MSTWQILGRSWRVWMPVVVLHAALQALLVAPFITPATSVTFAGLVVAGLAGAVASVALVSAGMHSAFRDDGMRWPSWGEWLAVLLLVLAVSASAVAAAWLAIPALVVAAIMLPAIFDVAQRRAWGFGLFTRAPLRAILLTLLTITLVSLLWFAAAVLGFFVTGWVGAALTWLLFGLVGTVVLASWFATPRRVAAGQGARG